MAGIAFSIRKLADRNNITGLIGVLFYSVLVSSGPWLFTTIGVGMILVLGPVYIPLYILRELQTIIIYNFSFSFVFSGLFHLPCAVIFQIRFIQGIMMI